MKEQFLVTYEFLFQLYYKIQHQQMWLFLKQFKDAKLHI